MTAAPGQLTREELLERARKWIDDDPDPRTRDELSAVLEQTSAQNPIVRADALADLADRFSGPLQFGTAGLRGRMGAGEHRMNRAVVIRAAAGFAEYLMDSLDRNEPRVVIGYDARADSEVFAHDSAAVFAGAGCHAILLPSALPTPVLAFAVRALDADAGVMVTASHNPPQDNGYKVYLGGRMEHGPGSGAQIVPPADTQIAEAIKAVPSALRVPMPNEGWTLLNAGILDAYLSEAIGVLRPDGARRLTIVLTPLHGVGGAPVAEALARGGFTDVHVVPEQAEPDPAFPTVSFPNPEEPGALDLAIACARDWGADLVIANDPDADRCAVAVADPALPFDGLHTGWRPLRGDEVGWLLADYLLSARGGQLTEHSTVACSIVSSQMLGRIATAHGVRHTETLTGFKWLARVPDLVFGYEEALGYCVDPQAVRDKDGITAALVVAELAATLKASGRTLLDALDDLALRHGVHLTDQVSIRVERIDDIQDMMQAIRSAPPGFLGNSPVVSFEDLAAPGLDDALPPTDGVRLRSADGTRVVVRPSGTEPKLKCYLEAIVPVSREVGALVGTGLDRARHEARRRLEATRASVAAALTREG